MPETHSVAILDRDATGALTLRTGRARLRVGDGVGRRLPGRLRALRRVRGHREPGRPQRVRRGVTATGSPCSTGRPRPRRCRRPTGSRRRARFALPSVQAQRARAVHALRAAAVRIVVERTRPGNAASSGRCRCPGTPARTRRACDSAGAAATARRSRRPTGRQPLGRAPSGPARSCGGRPDDRAEARTRGADRGARLRR